MKQIIESGVYVKLDREVYGKAKGSIGKVIKGISGGIWEIEFFGEKSIGVLEQCLERVSAYPKDIHPHAIFALLIDLDYPAGTTVSIVEQNSDGSVRVMRHHGLDSWNMSSKLLREATIAEKIRHLFTR